MPFQINDMYSGGSKMCKGGHNYKPIFHWEWRLCWLPNANEMDTNNMKCTCPTQNFCIGDPTQPIFHWLALGFCVRANADFKFCVRGDGNLRVCVGSKILTCWYPHAKFLRRGHCPTPTPKARYFASQWNIGYRTVAF